MVAHTCEFYTVNRKTVEYVNYFSIKLLRRKLSRISGLVLLAHIYIRIVQPWTGQENSETPHQFMLELITYYIPHSLISILFSSLNYHKLIGIIIIIRICQRKKIGPRMVK